MDILFLSTLPARGATTVPGAALISSLYFYPRSPRGERPGSAAVSSGSCRFLSTLPARGATAVLPARRGERNISIHAPREGSDLRRPPALRPLSYFYPRSPRGERLRAVGLARLISTFLSTLPARGATQSQIGELRQKQISIHAPREGSDGDRPAQRRGLHHFYPRSPRGERRGGQGKTQGGNYFYPRSPRGERHVITCIKLKKEKFLSTLPARGAT